MQCWSATQGLLDFAPAGAYATGASPIRRGKTKKTWTLGFVLAALAVPAGKASDQLLRFNGGIGVDPVSGIAAGAPTPNTVRGVGPGGAPWRIAKLTASIDVGGRISVRGRGLAPRRRQQHRHQRWPERPRHPVLRPGRDRHLHTTTVAGVPLAANGDFRIDDTLTPTPPNPCTTPVLLITNPAPSWFAAGILANDEDDD